MQYQSFQCLRTFNGHADAVESIAISPNGQTLVSGSFDKTIKVWNLNTGEVQRTLEGDTSAVTSVAISPSGQVLVSGSLNGTVKLWNLNTGEVQHSLEGPYADINPKIISGRGAYSGGAFRGCDCRCF